ncbi:FkbM family methyltransferase [Fuscovulum ytuae]|uniref:FkbM family methyltransferase n=1 Tax=Fuscovulum ytuae TaxID=3042299 RepID=A0ABY8Q807_9RHOB|nr:FkbM family methyltransferase [Fuscovulum sp. YMD61]WGV16804.1 FkbM family methyltransferase [Fuscovulum sp. YMD61]
MSDPTDRSDLPPAARLLLDRLPFPRRTAVIDVGANPIHPAPYTSLLQAGGCTITGFEPQQHAFAALQKQKGPNETYFPFAVGDGKTQNLHLFNVDGFTSIYPPYLPTYEAIARPRWCRVDRIEAMDTVSLDGIPDLGPCDLLKIDIQGGEKLVFDHARKTLAETMVVIVELRYLQLYDGEPMVGGVDCALRDQGFMLHRFMFNKSIVMPSSQAGRLSRRRAGDQLIDGDGVYIRHPGHAADWSDGQLMHLALLAGSVFGSHSLVLWTLDELVRRGACAEDLPAAYVDLMPERFLSDDEQLRRAEATATAAATATPAKPAPAKGSKSGKAAR